MDIRRIIIIFVVAILYALFSQLEIDALKEEPRCETYCPPDEFGGPMCMESYDYAYPAYPPTREKYIKREPGIIEETCPQEIRPSDNDVVTCMKEKGQMKYKYNQYGCIEKYKCDYCSKPYTQDKSWYHFHVFWMSALFALIAIVIGIMLPTKNPINEWIGFGLMLGGLITLFVGTGRTIGELGKMWRPLIILAELILVIYLSYKKIKVK
ncbi:hypothetical protein HY639_06000 [Candidatus Woesearchaeota archaeon]|nr:hypothetical protein [Candidatus Woesearchaeota archaeon]